MREIPAYPLDLIRRQFNIAPIQVTGRDGGGFKVRVVTGLKVNGLGSTVKFDYFICTSTGDIIAAPHGHAKNYRPGRIAGLAEAVEQPAAQR